MHAEVIESTTTSRTCEANTLDSRLDLLSGVGLVLRAASNSGRGLCSRVKLASQLAAGTDFLRVTGSSNTKAGFPSCLVMRRR